MKLLADEPATLQWPELRGAPWGQKNDPVQRYKKFPTLRAAANYGATELPASVRKNAIITVGDTPALYWDTWRFYCDAADEVHQP